MFQKIIAILKQPHPGYPNLSGYFKTVGAISIVVFLILSFLQPFNIGHQNIEGNTFLTALIYASGAAIVMSINSLWLLLLPSWFKNWTLGKDLLVLFYQLMSIGVGLWLINSYAEASARQGYTRAIFLAFAIGILPYVIVTVFKHSRYLRESLKQAELMNLQLKAVQAGHPPLFAKPEDKSLFLVVPKPGIRIPVPDFLYAESKGNNLHVFWLDKEELKTEIFRCTIHEFTERNTIHSSFFRCHRSYIVNMDKVQQIQGNAAGYQLILHPQLMPVTVARSYVQAFKKHLEQ
ncbi:LytTR family DNA-binding domain-containing protein [Niabella sp. 22666]|uniref:LytTR family DNA-binding domain-containing protein n=1 Tax=Niabella sp. 22666 TaxID=3453954 RepID=UPI003F834B58